MNSCCDNTGECQVLRRYTLAYIELKRYDFHTLPSNGSGIINIKHIYIYIYIYKARESEKANIRNF